MKVAHVAACMSALLAVVAAHAPDVKLVDLSETDIATFELDEEAWAERERRDGDGSVSGSGSGGSDSGSGETDEPTSAPTSSAPTSSAPSTSSAPTVTPAPTQAPTTRAPVFAAPTPAPTVTGVTTRAPTRATRPQTILQLRFRLQQTFASMTAGEKNSFQFNALNRLLQRMNIVLGLTGANQLTLADVQSFEFLAVARRAANDLQFNAVFGDDKVSASAGSTVANDISSSDPLSVSYKRDDGSDASAFADSATSTPTTPAPTAATNSDSSYDDNEKTIALAVVLPLLVIGAAVGVVLWKNQENKKNTGAPAASADEDKRKSVGGKTYATESAPGHQFSEVDQAPIAKKLTLTEADGSTLQPMASRLSVV